MGNVNQDKKSSSKERVTATPNDKLIERAKRAMRREGIPSQTKLQDRIELETGRRIGRNTISKFFNQKPILLDIFNIICKTLKLLDFELEIQELEEEENEGQEKEEKQEKASFAIAGTVKRKSIETLKSIISILEDLAVDAFVANITPGSLKLILEGSQSGLEKIEELFQSGGLKNKITEQNLDIAVKDVSFMGTKFFGKPQLVITIPGDFNQADIDILKDVLKDELIDISANNIISRIPIVERLLILLLFFFLGMPLIVGELFPVIFQDTPKRENKNDSCINCFLNEPSDR
ncbi:hypothetical protein [Okeania sp. SIO2B3]|uniref:hypothetical protein n=1 Tax=Okeania sp. SIO2B3 TaxID=2607784 RepID=UPI0013C07B27|nr:hypothetical protein [Okeania sp. SIO2B3]NET43232.1 hypothetical protein [Okeania sp. SIO2B3]